MVFSQPEAQAVLAHLDGYVWLVALLMYGAGLRLMAALRLRVKDVDFQRGEITVRQGKGSKDCMTVLPQRAIPILQQQIEYSASLHALALKKGICYVHLSDALARKYPSTGKELA